MIADDVDRAIVAAREKIAAEKIDNDRWWTGQQDRLRERRQVK